MFRNKKAELGNIGEYSVIVNIDDKTSRNIIVNMLKLSDKIVNEGSGTEVKLNDLEEIYLAIGNGKAPVGAVINTIHKNEESITPKVVKITSKSIDADIIVSGIDKVKVNLANCCHPVYGDSIVGYITKGNGITVHRMNCHNLEMLEDRTLEVLWNNNSNKHYLTCLAVTLTDNENHMLELIQAISMMNVSVDSIKNMNRGDKSIYEVLCYVTGIDQLDKLILNMKKNNFVEKN